MDFSKAFDKVGHDRLLTKLEHYGITGLTDTWIRQFLTGRRQRVVLDGEHSDQVAVTSGVPQGSVLVPCLFLLYINDLAEDLESVVSLLADDTIAYLTIDSQSDTDHLQRHLDRLAHREVLWQMEFHPEKCQVLRVSKKHKPSYCGSYTLHGQLLEIVDHAKYLGVTIQGDLRWDTHVTNITNKANFTLAVLKRNARVPSKCIKAAAYKALVRPHFEYCSTVWDPSTKHLSKKIEMVQRRSARWVCNSYRTGPNSTGPTEMLNDLDWPPLQTRRQNARLSLLYKMANNLVHMSSLSLLTSYPYLTKKHAHPCIHASGPYSKQIILFQLLLPKNCPRMEPTSRKHYHSTLTGGLQSLACGRLGCINFFPTYYYINRRYRDYSEIVIHMFG